MKTNLLKAIGNGQFIEIDLSDPIIEDALNIYNENDCLLASELLNQRNELLDNLKRIIDRIKENDLNEYFPSAYNRAVECINNIKHTEDDGDDTPNAWEQNRIDMEADFYLNHKKED